MLQLGRALRDAGELREAERVLTASLSLQNRSAEHDEVRVRWTEFNLAIVLDRLGEHEAARRLWERVLESSDRDDGTDSELSRQTAINLAITLRKLRRYGDEFPLRVRVLESTRRSLGPTAPRPSGPRSTWPRRTGISATTNWPWACSPRRSPVWSETEGDQRTILYQKWAIATELVALKRSKEASAMFDQVVAGAVEHLEPDDPFRRSAVRQRRGYWLLGKFSGLGRKARTSARHAETAEAEGHDAVTRRHGYARSLLALDVDGVLLDSQRGGRGPWQVAFGERFGVDARRLDETLFAGSLGRRHHRPSAPSNPPWPMRCTSWVGTWASRPPCSAGSRRTSSSSRRSWRRRPPGPQLGIPAGLGVQPGAPAGPVPRAAPGAAAPHQRGPPSRATWAP